MSGLNADANFEDADAFYASLANALDRAQSDRHALQLTLRLAIILAHQIGSKTALSAAIAIAQEPVLGCVVDG